MLSPRNDALIRAATFSQPASRRPMGDSPRFPNPSQWTQERLLSRFSGHSEFGMQSDALEARYDGSSVLHPTVSQPTRAHRPLTCESVQFTDAVLRWKGPRRSEEILHQPFRAAGTEQRLIAVSLDPGSCRERERAAALIAPPFRAT